MKTAFIIDSTAYASKKLMNDANLYELKLSTRFKEGTEFLDSTDLKTQKNFYKKLKESKDLPVTSQPAPGKYIQLVEEIIDEGYDQLICIHISAAFSGAYQTAKMVTAEYIDQIDTIVIDSKGVSLIMEYMVIQAMEMLEKKLNLDEIEEKLNWVAKESVVYLTVDDLEYVIAGGRIGPAQAKLGNLLRIKPLLQMDEKGEVQLLDKVRTDRRINKQLAFKAKEAVDKYPNGIMLGFAHALARERMDKTIKEVTALVPELSYKTAVLGPVIGTHTGAGTIGMGTIPIADY
ncbi:MAG: DegV family protein [Atopostipes suicloacalis]|nr:DegV family protein [Atopostipes suicloacalis]